MRIAGLIGPGVELADAIPRTTDHDAIVRLDDTIPPDDGDYRTIYMGMEDDNGNIV